MSWVPFRNSSDEPFWEQDATPCSDQCAGRHRFPSFQAGVVEGPGILWEALRSVHKALRKWETLSTAPADKGSRGDELSAGGIWLGSALLGAAVPICTSKDLALWLPLRVQFPS